MKCWGYSPEEGVNGHEAAYPVPACLLLFLFGGEFKVDGDSHLFPDGDAAGLQQPVIAQAELGPVDGRRCHAAEPQIAPRIGDRVDEPSTANATSLVTPLIVRSPVTV